MTNDLIGNHVSNWQNTIFTPGSHDPFGQGAAWGKVCTVHSPFGIIDGQVTHGGARFGMYLVRRAASTLTSPDHSLPRFAC